MTGRWMVWGLALVTSLAGAWMSWDLMIHYGKVPAQGQKASQSFLGEVCESFAWADCDEAADSPWAWFPFGATGGLRVSTASLGMAYFVAMVCWLLLVGWPSPSRSWVQLIPLMVTGFGVGMSIYLEYVLWSKLDKLCLLCILTHVATFLNFVFLILLWPREEAAAAPVVVTPGTGKGPNVPAAAASHTRIEAWPTRWLLGATAMITAALVVYVLLIGIWRGQMSARAAGGATTQPGSTDLREVYQYYQNRLQRYEAHPEHVYLAWTQAPKLEIPFEGRPAQGPANARHTVVIFSDFECPACGKYKALFKEKIAPMFDLPNVGGVRVIFKQWPIGTSCNPHATRDTHPNACQAAYAAEAAYALGGDKAFWNMHDLLFEEQDVWKDTKDFAALAARIGLDRQRFQEAMASDRVRWRVKTDIDDGENLGKELLGTGKLKAEDRNFEKVSSTPSVYLDGKRLIAPHIPSVWRRALVSAPAPSPGDAAPPTSTQPGDLASVVQDLQEQLQKRDQLVDDLNKYYQKALGRFENRPEHTYLSWQLAPPLAIRMEGRPAKGPDHARHTVVLFNDFECPTCKAFHLWFERAVYRINRVESQPYVRVVFKHWPICQECNPKVSRDLHPAACQAAYAAEAAFVLGGSEMFWRMHDLLYQRQDDWKKSLDFASLARDLGLNEQAFLSTMKSPEVKARVEADIREGRDLGMDLVVKNQLTEDQREFVKVDSTPAVFVDGKRLYSLQHSSTWHKILGYVPRPRTQPAAPATPPASVFDSQPSP